MAIIPPEIALLFDRLSAIQAELDDIGRILDCCVEDMLVERRRAKDDGDGRREEPIQ